ncbi:LuxR C-terminal-related transcriptional regulator [Arthrobacter sp. LAPM80]|uniref:response regulator transcription factor n=1 Tax=Arthrobacter sp. LAPM80 TaxID=3141788 RepID=UPI00398A79B1
MGATSLLRELAALASGKGAVIALHGTPSLATIPFGILAPYLRRTSSSFVESHVDAIRKTLALLEEQQGALVAKLGMGASLGHPLMIIDEADYLDRATAEVVVSLTQAGKIKLVIAHRAANEPVSPLPRLWDTGLAEKFRLQPLSRGEGNAFCAGALGGQTTTNTSWYFWNTAGGNPLLMRLVMEDALSRGKLRQIDGVWVMDMEAVPAGHQLQEVVREQLRGLSAPARETLDLVALSEPVPAETVSSQLGSAAIGDLFERNLLQETSQGSGILRLVNPVYGEVIREMVPHSRSKQLHSRLISDLEAEPSTPESLLRIVIWTLESGRHVPDEKLLPAAIFACKLYESGVALRLAGEVSGAGNLRKAHAVKARAKFNMGQYLQAAQLLELDSGHAESISEMLFGSLLRAATHSALGLSTDVIHTDAAKLRFEGERLARLDPGNAAEILWRAGERADVIDLMALSRAGRYVAMVPHIERVLGNAMDPTDLDHLCNRSIALAMDAERLSAIGFPLAARERAAAAFAIKQAEDHDVYFVPEMIISRAQIASLTAGEWDESEQLLQFLAVDVGKATISFGGSVGVARGMLMLRQGNITNALAVLLEGLDALQHSDPQQLFGYCAAMAAYAAARTGQDEIARKLVRQYREDASMFIVVAHERAFIAAAREHLDGDGTGLAELLTIADDAADRGLVTAELNALSLMLDFDTNQVIPRILPVAHKVEGRWAAGLAVYAQALGLRTASEVVNAAEQLLEAQMYQHAGKVLRFASSLVGKDREGNLFAKVRQGLDLVELALTTDGEFLEGFSKSQRRTREMLTSREMEIGLMAAQGLTDKVIAAQLHVSVRTVEGHLYRAYAKLGITDRKDLAFVLSD